MLIICNRNDLLKSVGTVSKAVSVRTTMPILEDILLEAEEMIWIWESRQRSKRW